MNLKYLYSTGSGELLFLEYKNSSPFYLAGLFILFLPPNIYLIVPLLAPSFAYMPINGYGCRPTLAGRSRCSILRFSSLLFFIAYLVFTPEIFLQGPSFVLAPYCRWVSKLLLVILFRIIWIWNIIWLPCGYLIYILDANTKYKYFCFIHANYEDVADYFKDDVIISCLCIGYLIPYSKVKAKRLIVNNLDIGKSTAVEISKKEMIEK